jgi:WD40 repeat protein
MFLALVTLAPAHGQKANAPKTDTAGHSNSVLAVAFDPLGKLLASASGDQTIKLWEVASGNNIANWTGHKKNVYKLAFSPDGKTVASVSARTRPSACGTCQAARTRPF